MGAETAVSPRRGGPSPRRGLRVIALSSAVLLIVTVLGATGAVALGILPNPYKLSVSQVAARVSPSVVTVTATIFRDGTTQSSGFFFWKPGYILTNAHILTRATSVTITDSSNRLFGADVLGIDRDRDIAELYTVDSAPQPLVAAQDPVNVGSEVVVIGDASGVRSKKGTQGVVVETDRRLSLNGKSYSGMIRTSAVVDPSSSGGPMVNMSGEVVGMVAAGSSGNAYALPHQRFDTEVAGWRAAGKVVKLGPPLVTASSEALVLLNSGPSGPGWTSAKSEVWGQDGWHHEWIKPADYTYGSAAVDIYMLATSLGMAESNYQTYVATAGQRGYTSLGALTGLGDEASGFQYDVSARPIYELVWRDRNCVVVLYLAGGMPPPPDVSMDTAVSLAKLQEAPIEQNLTDWQ